MIQNFTRIVWHTIIIIWLIFLSFPEAHSAQAPAVTVEPVVVEQNVTPVADTMSLEQIIDKFSLEYNIPKAWLINLAKCESTMGKYLIGDGGYAYGVYQYHEPTWKDFERWSGMDLDKYSMYDQTKMTAWALSTGRGYNWSCDYRTGFVK